MLVTHGENLWTDKWQRVDRRYLTSTEYVLVWGVSGLVRWPRDHLPSVQRGETDETKLKPFLQAEQGVGSDRAERLRSWAVAPAAKCEEMPGQTCLGSDHECSH